MNPFRSVSIVANPDKASAQKALPALKSWLKRKGIRAHSAADIATSDGVIVLGGDGTILSIAPKAARAGVPVLGINIGRLGFMTAAELSNMNRALQGWLQGKWGVSQRMMLEVTAPRVKEPLLALNDAVVRIGSTSRVMTIAASIENEKLGHFTGDGVIVATPTGSTAYSLAAQGPVIHPEVDALVLTPICAHSFTQRPVVFPGEHTLELELTDTRVKNEVQLCLDGQRVFHLRPGDRISVRASTYKLELVRDPDVSYFGILREKLSWGER